jgi:thioredoxin-like negative regulator of GroEL
VIAFQLPRIHASWCKSCKLFGKQYERIGREIGDLESVNDSSTIVREGEIRLAQIEFGKNTALCKSLGVTKVPSIQFYSQDKKVDDFPCGPKKIAHTLERLNYFRSLSPQQLAFEADMGQGEELGGELLEQLVTDNSNTEEGGKRKKILPNVAR